jgi:AcrR family transcriptional regulator
MTEPSAREAKRQDKRDRIAACALECFEERGFHATRIDDIVQAAGVAKGTFYLHFESKEALVLELMSQFTAELGRILTWVGDEFFKGDADPMIIFGREAEDLVRALFQQRALARWLFKEGRSVSEEIDRQFQTLLQSLIVQSADNLKIAEDKGWIQCPDPTLAATLIVGGVMQLYAQWLEEKVERPLEQLVVQVLFMYGAMLGLDFPRMGTPPNQGVVQ